MERKSIPIPMPNRRTQTESFDEQRQRLRSRHFPRRIDLPILLVFEILKLLEDVPKIIGEKMQEEQKETVNDIKGYLLSELDCYV
ncbi:hypothetical protein C4585_01560 [Candidatus Parcubacteria bacterium]|nr:MAG: hypothetical protein C4585_01560 [Candidatus Parcubacteria bacterium]